jgi:hypothetical protein
VDLCGLGYDKSRADYLIVLMCCYSKLGDILSHLKFISLRDNKWREIRNTSNKHKTELFYNMTIHWFAICHDLSMHFGTSHLISSIKLFILLLLII